VGGHDAGGTSHTLGVCVSLEQFESFFRNGLVGTIQFAKEARIERTESERGNRFDERRAFELAISSGLLEHFPFR
jgi:hypothetical protein